MTTNPKFSIDTSIKHVEIGGSGKNIKIPDGWDQFVYRGMKYQRDLDGQFVCVGPQPFPNGSNHDDAESRQACDYWPRQ